MATLIVEAERRFLGAMLADRDLEPENVLKAEEFVEPAHEAVYTAILRARVDSGLDGADLSAQVAELADVPGVDRSVLESLRTHAPDDPNHVLVYAQMIGTASMCRDMVALAETNLEGRPEPDPIEARAQAALLRHSANHLELFNSEVDVIGSEPDSETSERVALEEQLVASLIADPAQVRTLVGICPPETFQGDRTRAAYEIVAGGAWNGAPVSDLDLIYKLGQGRLALEGSDWAVQRHEESDSAFVRRLVEMPIIARSGTEAARALLALDIRNDVAPQEAPLPEMEHPPHPAPGLGPEPPTPRPRLGGGLG